jgi:hypothetical protein
MVFLLLTKSCIEGCRIDLQDFSAKELGNDGYLKAR